MSTTPKTRDSAGRFERLVTVGASPCEKACPNLDLCYEFRMVCRAYEEYVNRGDYHIKPGDPSEEIYRRVYPKRQPEASRDGAAGPDDAIETPEPPSGT